jgi:hypothetical protein
MVQGWQCRSFPGLWSMYFGGSTAIVGYELPCLPLRRDHVSICGRSSTIHVTHAVLLFSSFVMQLTSNSNQWCRQRHLQIGLSQLISRKLFSTPTFPKSPTVGTVRPLRNFEEHNIARYRSGARIRQRW